MMTLIGQYFDALVVMMAEMAPYLMLGFFIAGLLRTVVPRTVYSRLLSPRDMKSVVKAAAIGIPLPLCSCGVIPTSVSLRKEGASHGACTSFLIATPQTGVDSIAATYSMMGLPFAIVRPVAALFTAMFGGWMVNRYAKDDERHSAEYAHSNDECEECCDCSHHDAVGSESFWEKFKGALAYGYIEMLQDVGKWLVIGLLIAALITVTVPNEWLAALHEYKLLNMLIVLAIAIPMYVCATGSIPIAVSLMAKGLTPGAALVLLMAGPAVNSASMLVIGKVFGRRTLWMYLLSIIIGAIVFGLGIDYLLPQEWFSVQAGFASMGDECTHGLSVMEWVWIAVLVVLLANAFWQAHHGHGCCCENEGHGNHEAHESHEPHKHHGQVKYSVHGMSCNHCKANVERAIRSVEGVEDVEVSLVDREAIVVGSHDTEELINQLKSYGYEASRMK